MTDYLTNEVTPRIVSTGQAFTIGSFHYGPEWLGQASATDLAAAGLTPVAYTGAPGDQRYFAPSQAQAVISGGVATIAWANVPLALAAVKAAKFQDLNAFALAKDSAGTTFLAVPIFTTDHFKILYAIANQQAAAGLLTTLNLPDATGAFHPLSAAQIQALYAAVAGYIAAVLANQNVHQTAISALPTAAAVIAYDFTTGWPT